MFFDTEDLVSAAKRSEFFPVSQTTFTDPDDLIAFANEEMLTKIVPAILSVRQDYFLAQSVVQMRSYLNHYALPERAIGNDLKDLFYLPDSGSIDVRYSIPRRQVHDLGAVSSSFGSSPTAFYLKSDEVVIAPTPGSISGSDGLLYFYFMRPSKLVPTAQCGKITAISSAGGTTTFTVNADLTTLVSSGGLIDVLTGRSPFRLPAVDVAITAIAANSIDVATSDVTDESGTLVARVGDFLCPAQTACIPMIPQEFHPILAELICFRALKALGATQHLQVLASNVKDMMAGAMKLISTRVESEPEVVYDRHGLLGATNPYYTQFVLR